MKNTLLGQAQRLEELGNYDEADELRQESDRRHEDELAAWRTDEDERRHNERIRKLKRKKTTQ